MLAHRVPAANREKGHIPVDRLARSQVVLSANATEIALCYTSGMFAGALQRLLGLPLSMDPPEQSWRDWLLMLALVVAGLLEGVLRSDLGWRPVVIAVAVVAPLVIPLARAYPLPATVIVFGGYGLLHVEMFITSVDSTLVNPATLLVLTHVLVRWAPGRHIGIGLGVAAVCWMIAWSIPSDSLPVMVLKGIVISLPVISGAATRHLAEMRHARALESRFNERHQIARELHDTLAHRMTAIAIQAQAGRAIAASDPKAVLETLATIEDTASSSLQDMRDIIGVLRDSGSPIESHHTVADIERIANTNKGETPVRVRLEGKLDDLGASVEAGLFRVVQESITNARRYARDASRISVHINGSADAVQLTVTDDGDPVRPGARIGSGYGIIGMTERVSLLGGDLSAGRGPAGRWVVDAQIPKNRG